jgi:hypothetical protein
MREGVPTGLDGIPTRKPQVNDAIPKIAPKWLKYDRQVSTDFNFILSAFNHFAAIFGAPGDFKLIIVRAQARIINSDLGS